MERNSQNNPNFLRKKKAYRFQDDQVLKVKGKVTIFKSLKTNISIMHQYNKEMHHRNENASRKINIKWNCRTEKYYIWNNINKHLMDLT